VKTERVYYHCDQCGNRASEKAIYREGQWREIRFGHVGEGEGDVRQVCSYECARLLLADIIKNLLDNDEELEADSRPVVMKEIVDALKKGSKPWEPSGEDDEEDDEEDE
jgi:hypothetical protein